MYSYNIFIYIEADNKLYAWGEAKFGQLGLGNNFNTYLKQPVLVDIKNIENKIKEIYAGFRQSYILLADSSSILVSGSNKFLELGIKSDKNTLFDFETLSIISESKLIKLSIGQKHALSLDENGCVYGWGSNKYGQLGIENTNQENCYLPMKLNIQDVKDFSSGWSHNLFLTSN